MSDCEMLHTTYRAQAKYCDYSIHNEIYHRPSNFPESESKLKLHKWTVACEIASSFNTSLNGCTLHDFL